MLTFFETICLGVLSGILTTLILWLLSLIYKIILLPYIEQMLYKGVNISGDWVHHYNDNIEIPKDNIEKIKDGLSEGSKKLLAEGTITPIGSIRIIHDLEIALHLNQKAYRLTGYFRVKNLKNEKEYTNYFKINGTVADNYVIFSYQAEKSDRTGMGSFLLRVANGGTQLIGSATFTPDAVSEDSTIVVRENMSFKRV